MSCPDIAVNEMESVSTGLGVGWYCVRLRSQGSLSEKVVARVSHGTLREKSKKKKP